MLKEHESGHLANLSDVDAQYHQDETFVVDNFITHGSARNYVGRMPLKRELVAMSFKDRVAALMQCADHHLEEMDRLEDRGQTGRLSEWDRRQLSSHRASLKRVLDRALEFGIKLSVVEE
ncbi:hypothetical protein [Methylobacterium nodulans]|nr:hypothetical protein [Methylobacterium nodulans]